MRWVRDRWLVLGVVGFVVIAACSESAPEGRSADLSVSGPEGPGTTAVSVTPDEVVADVLADGDVTDAEMERVILAAVGCIEDRGFDVTYEFTPRVGWSFDVEAGRTEEEAERAGQALDECEAAFVMPVGSTYLALHGRSEAELAEAIDELRRCMEDKGVEIPDGLGFADWPELDPVTYATCAAPLGL